MRPIEHRTVRFRIKGSALTVRDRLMVPSGDIFLVTDIAFKPRLNRQDVTCKTTDEPMRKGERMFKLKLKEPVK